MGRDDISPEGSNLIRVLLADDHDTFRKILRDSLQIEPDIEIIGEAATGEEAIRQAESLDPDVILMDIVMPELDGVAATARISKKHPRARIIAYSMHDSADLLKAMVHAGAIEYVRKDAPLPHVLKAIRGTAD
jgi:DNA-binding NarL/FixJ family response regulator